MWVSELRANIINKYYRSIPIKNDPMKEIYNQNRKIIQEIKKNYNVSKIHIIGKGPSATYIPNEFTIGINQGLIFTNGEILCMNDFQSLFGIEHLIPKIKYIFMPYQVHVYNHPIFDFTYKNVLEFLSEYNFTGKVFVYFIQTTLIEKSELNDDFYFNVECSTMSAIKICNRFLNDSILYTYGYKNGAGYHPDIATLVEKTYSSDKYTMDKYQKYYNFTKNLYKKNMNTKSSTKKLHDITKVIQLGEININLS